MGLLQKLFPLDDLKDTAMRFPLSVGCALVSFCIAVLGIHDVIDFDDDFFVRLAVVLGAGYLWFGIAKLAAESLSWDAVRHYGVAAIGAVAIAGLTLSGSIWWMNFWYLVPALLLIIMFAAYLKGGDDLSFWFFNRKMWFGVLVSYVALLLFSGGLTIAFFAVHELFGVEPPEEVFGYIWAFACLVLGPLYALSWVPKSFAFTQEDCNDPPGLKFIVNWISAPIVFVYLLILYAYFIKIGVTGEVPNGLLAYLISGFVGAGVVTYLAAHPLREEGSPQLRLFYKIFFPALLVPVAFHFYAIWERVSAYGFTEQRYMLLLSAIWFAFLAIGNIFWRLPIKSIPMVLAGLMVLASFGPWGAVSVSGKSQLARLEALLEKNTLLDAGRAVKREDAGDVISFDDRQNISSIIEYLCRTDRDALIKPWFEVKEDKAFACNAYELTKEFGFEHVSSYQREQTLDSEYITLNGQSRYNRSWDVDGYKRFLTMSYMNTGGKGDVKGHEWEGDPVISSRYEGARLIIDVEGHGEISFDVLAFAKGEIEKSVSREARDLILEGSNGVLRAKLSFETIGVNKDKKTGEHVLQNISYTALVDY